MSMRIDLPVAEEKVRGLNTGDILELSGTVVTARDVAHKYMYNSMIRKKPEGDDLVLFDKLKSLLAGSFIYHCGPVMKSENGTWQCVAAGPTTSIREEPYEADVLKLFGAAGVIGKGGMGEKTLSALQETGGVYLHAVGGAAAVAAERITDVREVLRIDFGMPEAMWVLELNRFPVIVTMDSHGSSIHKDVMERSTQRFTKLMS